MAARDKFMGCQIALKIDDPEVGTVIELYNAEARLVACTTAKGALETILIMAILELLKDGL